MRRHSPGADRDLWAIARRYSWTSLVLAGVLLMFFCPLPRGSFQATHGPATALRASRAALLTLQAIAATIGIPLSLGLASFFLLLFLSCLMQDGVVVRPPADDLVRITCELRC